MLGLAAAGLAAPLPGWAAGALRLRHPSAPGHPDPRPGIDGRNVLTAEQLTAPDLAGLFDAIREIPHIADGILCYCGCARLDGYRSLLSCYEKAGMAQYCEICQGEGRLAHARWKEGQSLAQIRRAIDARYGHGADAAGPGPAAGPAPDAARSSAAAAATGTQDHCHS